MAMQKCHECEREVSSEAKNCPGCGAKVKPLPKPMSRAAKLAIGAVVLLFVVAQMTKDEKHAAQAAKPPAQLAAEEAANKADSARARAARRTAATVKEHAKNPDSVKFTQIAVSDDATLVCASYRATNSFNAVVPGVMVVTKTTVSDDKDDWKKYCLPATGLHDHLHAGDTNWITDQYE